jgi:hypothetical protein
VLGIEHGPLITLRDDASGVRFDEHDAAGTGGKSRGEPACGIGAQRTAGRDETHVLRFTRRPLHSARAGATRTFERWALIDDLTTEDPHEVTDAITRSFVDIRRAAAGLSQQLTQIASVLPLECPRLRRD